MSMLTINSIALVKNHIRIVQASLVGSILANLLLILGMCFLLGGLRFREQIYNSTVTQMSACLLALSVTSLLLPTAFHESFSSETKADDKVLQVSRGTSVIVLVVYFLYLIFQLKSHSYMYASTPQELVQKEALPGPAAQYFNSPGALAASSDWDSDGSSRSARPSSRLRRTVRGGKRVTRSADSDRDTQQSTGSETPVVTPNSSPSVGVSSTDQLNSITLEDGITRKIGEPSYSRNRRHQKKRSSSKHPKHATMRNQLTRSRNAFETSTTPLDRAEDGTACFDFATAPALEAQARPSQPPRRSPRLNQTLVAWPLQMICNPPTNDIRRTKSEPFTHPSMLRHPDPTKPPLNLPSAYTNNSQSHPTTTPDPRGQSVSSENHNHSPSSNQPLTTSRITAIALLIISTTLVAVCAEFMVSSIDQLVATDPGLSEAFIGLILLPVVGNAAEHVTAVRMAMKNKMDLAIGVAVGSSIQIALFVTPLVVMLGWALGKDMSLFFTLFETVCVFVSAFIVNFLVLDGRSNYLEGALLCAGYVIIAVAAFFHPDVQAASTLGGGD